MTRQGRHIGIYGGSFNPVHRGHIAIARHIAEHAALDEVWLMLSPVNPFKAADVNLADDNDRLQMLKLACADTPEIKPCDLEMTMPRPNYTINTLDRLACLFPTDIFSLIIGGDNWMAFDRWYRCEDILATHNIIIYPRPTDSPSAYSTLPENVSVVTGSPTLLDISSTDIRQRLRDGRDVSDMLAPEVLEYIKTKRLYL